jgi:uncharacterized protein YbaR (Trm112 family)
MRKWLLDLLVCPNCATDDALEMVSGEASEDEINEGILSCPACDREYSIGNGIPRFVDPDENYAENFGYQWH